LKGYSPVMQGFMGTIFTWGVTALGALMVCVPIHSTATGQQQVLDAMLGFAAGVMVAASYWSLLAPAIESAENDPMYGPDGKWAFVPAAGGFFLGAVTMQLADSLLQGFTDVNEVLATKKDEAQEMVESAVVGGGHHLTTATKRRPGDAGIDGYDAVEAAERSEADAKEKADSWRRVLLLVIAVTVHNFPEGLAVGVGFGSVGKAESQTFEKARNLAVGIGLQNFPEGLAVSMPLYTQDNGLSLGKAFFWGQLSGMVEPVGGVLGAYAVQTIEPLLPWALAYAAGCMIYVVFDSLIPEAVKAGNQKLATWGGMVGFLVMMTMDVALG